MGILHRDNGDGGRSGQGRDCSYFCYHSGRQEAYRWLQQSSCPASPPGVRSLLTTHGRRFPQSRGWQFIVRRANRTGFSRYSLEVSPSFNVPELAFCLLSFRVILQPVNPRTSNSPVPHLRLFGDMGQARRRTQVISLVVGASCVNLSGSRLL